MTRPVLRAAGTVNGRPYLLAVGLYALGVRLSTTRPGCDPVVLVHRPIRTTAEADDALAIARALAP